MSQRINQMAQIVRSRTNLQNIVNTFGLYKSDLQRKPMSDVIDDMIKDIKISGVESVQQSGRGTISAFKISFEYPNRQLAQKVTAELVNGFVNENLRSMQSSSTATTTFLTDQLANARKNLQDLENKMTQFRLKNAGRLPDELQGNLTTLRTIEQQLQGVHETMSRIGQEKLLLESQIRIYKDQLTALTQGNSDAVGAAAKSERVVQAERQIAAQEVAVASLRERYKDTYPDVQAAQAQLAMLKKNRDALLKEDSEQKPETAATKRLNPEQVQGGRQLEAAIQSLQSQIQAKDIELERRAKTQQQLDSMVNQYNARIQVSPLMEKEYAELSRDYTLAKDKYAELNGKKAASEIATKMEDSGQGERLQLLDPPSLPETPIKPQRAAVVGIGFAIGILLGTFVAAAREMKDTSLKSLKYARAYTNLPVLGTVPLLENDLVVRRKRRLAWLAWSAVSIAGVIAMAGSVWYHYQTRV
jgi:polysaccharide chain length determinant protein (PEP-CTERM system associated)